MAQSPRVPTPPTTTHSIRCRDDLWVAARKRAHIDGININVVVNELLTGYAEGKLQLPYVTKVWPKQ